MCSINNGRLVVGMEERLHLERYPFVLQRFDGLRVDDGGTVESQLDGFRVGNVWQLNRVGEAFRVGVEQTIHVLPDGDLFGIEAVGEDGRGEVGAFAAEGDAVLAVSSAADEALREAHDATDMLIVQLADFQACLVPIGVGGAESRFNVGDDIFACIEPACGDVAFAEVFLDNAGRNELAVANGLVVLVVVGRIGLLQFLPKFDEKAGDVLVEARVGVAFEQALDDAVVVADDFVQSLHAEVAVVLAEIGQDLFQHVGCLTHSGYHKQDVLVFVLANDLR